MVAICIISARVEPCSAATLNSAELAFDPFAVGKVRDFDHIYELVALFHHLLYLGIVTDHHDCDPAHVRFLAGADRKAFDVKTATGEETVTRERHPGLILYKDG